MGKTRLQTAICTDTFTREDTNAAKGIGVMLLLWHHLFWKITDMKVAAFKYFLLQVEDVHLIGIVGKICVCIFVLLSAYGMTVQYKKLEEADNTPTQKQTAQFISHRYLSLMAGFCFVYIIAYIAACFTSKPPSVVYGGYDGIRCWLATLADAMGLQYFFSTPTLNATWWYMTLAIQIIALFPLFYRWCKKDSWILLIGLAVIPRNLFSIPPYVCAYMLTMGIGVYAAQTDFLCASGIWAKKAPPILFRG